MSVGPLFQIVFARRRREFAITLTDDSAMAAAAMIGEASVSPLDRAAAELTALVAVAEPTGATAAVEQPAVPADATQASLSAASQPPVAAPDAPSSVPAVAPDTGTPAADLPATTPTPDVPTATEGADGTAREDAPTEPSSGSTPAGLAPGSDQGMTQDVLDGTSLADLEAAVRELLGIPETALDLEASARMLAVAQEVAALSAQIKLLADDVAAELAAAEEAAEAQRAAERAAQLAAIEAAARNLRTRIAATDAAPNGAIPLRLLCGVDFAKGALLRCDAAAALEDLNRAYRRAFGRNLDVSSTYRDLAGQVAAREAKGDLAATPGTSQHGRGLAVDFSGFGSVGEFSDPDYLWMAKHAAAYGWVHPPAMGPGGSGPLEPWHWEFGTH